MEISLKYILVRLEAILPFVFAIFYFFQGTVETVEKIEIKDRVNILTGICITIFYLYKLVKEIGKKDEIAFLKEEVLALKKSIDNLEKAEELKNDKQ